jgi:hypothetical protein
MKKMPNRSIKSLAAAVPLFLASVLPAAAGLDSVSGFPAPGNPNRLTAVAAGGDPAQVAVSLANGYPIWYQDTNGLKLELCLEQQVQRVGGGTFFPCLTAEPFTGAPISFPVNFGPEAFYWVATAVGSFTSTTGTGNALLVVGQEATQVGGLPFDGQQLVFARTRLRINVPVAGTYRVTHPFGTRDYVVTDLAVERTINQTQDIGAAVALDFLASLSDAPVPPGPPAPTPPSTNAGIVNLDGRSLGPFLEPNPFARIFDVNGNQYLADPGTEALPLTVPVQPGPDGVDYFEVTLLDPPDGFNLDATGVDGTVDNTVRITAFQVSGKVFNDGPNTAPLATADTAATTPGAPVLIDVSANDVDVVAIDLNDPFNPANPANANVHGLGLNPQAIAVVDGTQLARIGPVTLPSGATVRRVSDIATGRSFLLYTPQGVGEESFNYVIQDKGGLLSLPAAVTVTVENLAIDQADYRPRTGKWRITGSSSDVTGNNVTLHGAPRSALTGAGEVPPVTTDAAGMVALRVTEGSIEFSLQVDPLPASAVTAAHIHAGAAGVNGPIIFTLYNSASQGAFAGKAGGTLTASNLTAQPAAGVASFADAVDAILSGGAYVNVHTTANTGGEIRGQLARPLIGSAPVAADGRWEFSGKSTASPGALRNVSATSANGIRVLGAPLRLR